MRTAIILGFIILADAISASSGYEMSIDNINNIVWIFAAMAFMDVVDFLRGKE